MNKNEAYKRLHKHKGHKKKIVVNKFNGNIESLDFVCLDCNEVVLSIDGWIYEFLQDNLLEEAERDAS